VHQRTVKEPKSGAFAPSPERTALAQPWRNPWPTRRRRGVGSRRGAVSRGGARCSGRRGDHYGVQKQMGRAPVRVCADVQAGGDVRRCTAGQRGMTAKCGCETREKAEAGVRVTTAATPTNDRHGSKVGFTTAATQAWRARSPLGTKAKPHQRRNEARPHLVTTGRSACVGEEGRSWLTAAREAGRHRAEEVEEAGASWSLASRRP
jgi:hypothetical protein